MTVHHTNLCSINAFLSSINWLLLLNSEKSVGIGVCVDVHNDICLIIFRYGSDVAHRDLAVSSTTPVTPCVKKGSSITPVAATSLMCNV